MSAERLNDDEIEAGAVWWMRPADDENAEAVAATLTAVHRDGDGHVYAIDVRRESDGLAGAVWRRRTSGRYDGRRELPGTFEDVWAGFFAPRDPSWAPVAGSLQPFAVLLQPQR